MAPVWVIIMIKDYYGLRWAIFYRRRREFIAYYRLAITANCSYMLFDIVISLVNGFDDYQDGVVWSCILNCCLCIIQIVILEINMRYLDRLHVVSNEI